MIDVITIYDGYVNSLGWDNEHEHNYCQDMRKYAHLHLSLMLRILGNPGSGFIIRDQNSTLEVDSTLVLSLLVASSEIYLASHVVYVKHWAHSAPFDFLFYCLGHDEM